MDTEQALKNSTLIHYSKAKKQNKKNSQQTRIEGYFHNPIKGIYKKKPTVKSHLMVTD